MTEAEWNTCTDPQLLLGFLRGTVSNRKLRLFACAYARQLWTHMDDGRSRDGIEVAERYADGEANEEVRIRALEETSSVVLDAVANQDFERAQFVVYAKRCLEKANDRIVRLDFHFHPWMPSDLSLVRDIIGSPFRPVGVDPPWNNSNVTAFAEAIYTDRAFDRLPILADALEDAGCTDPHILAHCRGPGPHVRGCWVVDLLTGRK